MSPSVQEGVGAEEEERERERSVLNYYFEAFIGGKNFGGIKFWQFYIFLQIN